MNLEHLDKITSPSLAALPHIRHGFWTRKGGVSQALYQSLNCGFGSNDRKDNIRHNRNLIKQALNAEHLLTPHQTHSNQALFVLDDSAITADGIITRQTGLALGILTADCAPILLADRTKPIIAAVHAGWRGAVAGIIEAALQLMRKQGAEQIIAAIGPHISYAVYQVGQDMRSHALNQDPESQAFFQPDAERFKFDLGGYLKAQLERSVAHVDMSHACTFSLPERFFSHRYNHLQHKSDYGRQISAIMLL